MCIIYKNTVSLYIWLFDRGCSYERYTVPYDRSYKRMVREEYITKCGPWSWKSCVKTRSVYNARVLYLRSEVTEKWTRTSNKSILRCCLNNLCLKNKFSKIKVLKIPNSEFWLFTCIFQILLISNYVSFFKKQNSLWNCDENNLQIFLQVCLRKNRTKLRIEVQGPLWKYFWVSGTRSNSDKRQKQHSLQQQQNRCLLITTMSKYNASCFIWRP